MWTSTFNVMSTEIQKAYKLILNFIMEQQKKSVTEKPCNQKKNTAGILPYYTETYYKAVPISELREKRQIDC